MRTLDRPSETPLLMGLAALCRRIAAALVAFLTLRIGMWLYGVPLSEKYQALLIIVGLLSLILMSGRSGSCLLYTSDAADDVSTV